MKKLFQKENILEILNHIEEGIQIIDQKGRIVYFNKFAQNIDGINREKAIGRHLLEVYPSLSHESSTLLTVIKTGKAILKKEQTFVNYKGKKITTVNTSLPIKVEGEIVGALEISKDITQVRVMSEKIVDLQTKLYNNNIDNYSKGLETAHYNFLDIIGENKEMLRLKKLALRAAQTDAPVLIYGDTGTGKELFVHSIHNSSQRKHKPFISQNCAALPANLLEGILFGTVKGGFTGAEDRQGLFQLAHGGTLFLDEINSMPLELQSKLLRVLEDGYIRAVGGTKLIQVDARIITATNIPPEKAIEKQLLRNDLYYRLNVVNFTLPPLRERRDDLPLLTRHFIDKFNKKLGRSVKGISPEVEKVFYNYPWEGNVRELENLIEGIMSIYDIEIIEEKHLPKNIHIKKERGRALSLKETIEATEKKLIKEALDQADYNVSYAAELLDTPRQTLQYKISKYNL